MYKDDIKRNLKQKFEFLEQINDKNREEGINRISLFLSEINNLQEIYDIKIISESFYEILMEDNEYD
jgi:hypothetical protein